MLRFAILVAAATALPFTLAAAQTTPNPIDCANASLTVKMIYCAERDFAEADRVLNEAYSRALAEIAASDNPAPYTPAPLGEGTPRLAAGLDCLPRRRLHGRGANGVERRHGDQLYRAGLHDRAYQDPRQGSGRALWQALTCARRWRAKRVRRASPTDAL